jgi:hypothetical protein
LRFFLADILGHEVRACKCLRADNFKKLFRFYFRKNNAYLRLDFFLSFSSITACAAASREMGSRKGEALT